MRCDGGDAPADDSSQCVVCTRGGRNVVDSRPVNTCLLFSVPASLAVVLFAARQFVHVRTVLSVCVCV